VNPDPNRLYVSHFDSGDVRAIDMSSTSDHPPTVSVQIAGHPSQVALNRATNKVYVLSEDSRGQIVEIDGATNAATRIPATIRSPSPEDVVVNPVTNRIYAAFFDQVVVVDGATRALSYIPTGLVRHLAVDPVRNRGYGMGDSSFIVIDGATQNYSVTPMFTGPRAIAVNPATNRIYLVGVQTIVLDGAAVADAIRRVFENKAFKTKEVAASLSGNAVIVKKISLPVMTEAELAESIYWEAEQYIPFDIQDVNLDYQILKSGTGAESEGTMDVLLVAAKKEKIADYTGVISQAGRLPVIVDVDAFAQQNAYEVNYGNDPEAVVVLLNAGASAININIVTADQSVFTRDISLGGNSYTEAVQKEMNLPFESAEQLKRGLPVDGVTFEEVQPVLHAMTENVLLEIQKTFDFFKATASSDRIDRIVVSGGASRVDGFTASLTERFNTPVETFDPFKTIAFDPAKLGITDPEGLSATAAVAVGLRPLAAIPAMSSAMRRDEPRGAIAGRTITAITRAAAAIG